MCLISALNLGRDVPAQLLERVLDVEVTTTSVMQSLECSAINAIDLGSRPLRA
jgi:hypothetical protein